jgi:hypothetical protein
MAVICIEEGGFKFEQSTPDSLEFWDLSQLVKVKHKDGTESTEYKIRAYGISLAHCIDTVIGIRTRMKHVDSIKTLKDFLEAYKTEKAEVYRFFRLNDTKKLSPDALRKAE